MQEIPPPLKRARSSATGALVSDSGAEPSESTSIEEPKKIKAQTEDEAQLEDETELTTQTWEDLKELWENAMDEFEGSEPASAVPLLRGLIFECDRIVRNSPDPNRPLQSSSANSTLNQNENNSDQARWDLSVPSNVSVTQVGSTGRSSNTIKEHPGPLHPGQALSTFSFFHIYGTTLLTLADIFDQVPDLADPSEPSPVIINAKSIDFFEKALQGYQDEFAESEPRSPILVGEGRIASDWRLEIAWGRALVRLARQKLEDGDEEELPKERVQSINPNAKAGKAKGLMKSKKRTREPEPEPEPASASASAFPTVLAKTPVSLLSPRQLLTQAADHFQLGILLMPRPSPSATPSPVEPIKTPFRDPVTSFQPTLTSHQRLKNILEIATSVSPLVEKFSDQKERVRWATWTGGIFDQLEMEASPLLASLKDGADEQKEDWKFEVALGKGGLWLGLGSRLSEEFETSVEESEEQDEAQAELNESRRKEARELLQKALGYLQQGRKIRPRITIVQDCGKEEDEEDEIGPLLVEGYLTLSGLVDSDDDEEIERLEGLARNEGWVEDGDDEEDGDGDEQDEDEDEEDMSID
ncbi:Negative regulator of Ofd1/Enhancer of translation termination 1 [Phaffia rhodozyma]|uniref:Negative regulator of Ofd1/Enhancer of translation termination 1 n=1 Tax=Phaffia rhodozyma TaxID=264483 RepID=A0A0F7SUA6_PHARH|nr:Negative regulator of Ofd1/Enhancer of translation termination 1 [Phaffia rhodozyma]